MGLRVPPRRGAPEPWARTWVEESARAQFAQDPWATPALAKFALGFCLGMALWGPLAELILKVI